EGNRLIFESEDTAALDAVAGYLQATFGSGAKPAETLFKVIRLKNVLAEDAARSITEIFNGPQQQQRQGQGGLGGLFGGGGPGGLLGGLLGGGGAPAAPTGVNPNRVRVVAERSSNSLVVVKATPIDLLTIESLLARYIDAGVTEDAVTLRHWIVPVYEASASEMASIVREVYRSAMQSTGGQGGGPQIVLPFGPQPQQQASAQKPPALSVSVDDRSNSLILLCNEEMKRDVESLVRELDNKTVSNTETVKLVQLKGIDPN